MRDVVGSGHTSSRQPCGPDNGEKRSACLAALVEQQDWDETHTNRWPESTRRTEPSKTTNSKSRRHSPCRFESKQRRAAWSRSEISLGAEKYPQSGPHFQEHSACISAAFVPDSVMSWLCAFLLVTTSPRKIDVHSSCPRANVHFLHNKAARRFDFFQRLGSRNVAQQNRPWAPNRKKKPQQPQWGPKRRLTPRGAPHNRSNRMESERQQHRLGFTIQDVTSVGLGAADYNPESGS